MSETLGGVVELEEGGGRPPEMVLGVDTVAAVRAPPVLVVRRFRHGRQMTTTDAALDTQFGDERIAVRRCVQHDFVESACGQCVEGGMVSPGLGYHLQDLADAFYFADPQWMERE